MQRHGWTQTLPNDHIKSDRKRLLYDITYMWNLFFLMMQINVFIKQKMTYRYQEQSCDCQDDGGNKYRDGVGWIRSLGGTHTGYYSWDGWLAGTLMYSMGSSNQYPMWLI